MKVGYILHHTKIESKIIVGEVLKENVLKDYLNKTDEELDSVLKSQFKTLNNFFTKTNSDYDISYVDLITNLDLWLMIKEFTNNQIKDNKIALKKYMNFCKKNKINQKKLSELVGVEVPNIMKKLKSLEEKCL